ncbi:uncharacterized protein [Fopius arisanus]|uniref:UBP4 protein n=1 Tax=Fopius arisanus TaxID=64838 RepID=A0A0C9R5M7_9HYME|nr:PREDICTED: uncharacterized protein LOC105271420 [Fopius arisanus]
MLSVTTATVHRAMCPGTPQNPGSDRKERSWSCDYDGISKRRRASSSRKNLSLHLSDPLELNIEVSSHPIFPKRTPKSKIPTPKVQSCSINTSKSRKHSVAVLKEEITPSHSLCFNPLYKEASRKAEEISNPSKRPDDEISQAAPLTESPDIPPEEDVNKEPEEKQNEEKIPTEEITEATDANPSPKDEPLLSSSPHPATGGKRKRESESRLSLALKLLKSTDDDANYSQRRPDLDSTVDEPEDKTVIPQPTPEDVVDPQLHDDNWNTEDNWNKLQQEQQWEYNQQDNWVIPYDDHQEIWQNSQSNNWTNWDDGSAPTPADGVFEQVHPEEPYYMTGFPNPPAENRCWLNATLQTIFALPLLDHLGNLDMTKCSKLTKTLMAIQLFWKKGPADKDMTYQTVARFKSQLDILDDSYSSYRQQDVSEFLMKLLNHVKTDCEKIIKEMKSSEQEVETENVPEASSVVKHQRSPQTSTKRSPLTQISPFKSRNSSEAIEGSLPSPKPQESQELEESIQNPIDEFFLLPMMEHYVCQNCRKHRQRNIDNMMLYVDLPDNGSDPIELAAAISKTLEPEDRTLTCGKCKCEEHKLYTTFRKSPNVLIVQINRYGMSDGFVAKMNSIVHIPEELEISSEESINEEKSPQKFVPICTIAHVGSAMDCGHYTSYVKHGDQWFYYNDMSVTPMSTSEALTAAQTTAYLVFFVNVDILNKSSNTGDVTTDEVSR